MRAPLMVGGGGLALVVAATLVSLQGASNQATQQVRRHHADVVLDPGVRLQDALALDAPASPRTDGALALLHPPDGAVRPGGWPSPTIRWRALGNGRVHRVLAQAGDRTLTAFTREDEFAFDHADWQDLISDAETVTFQVSAAVVDASGAAATGVEAGPVATLTLETDEDAPEGMLLYGQKLVPPGKGEGSTTALMFMNLAILGLDMASLEPTVLFQSSYGPEPYAGPGADSGGPRCVSCHDVSPEGSYIAVFSQVEAETPERFDAPNGFLTVLAMPERRVVAQLPHAFMPVFSPVDEDTLLFSQVDETIGAKNQMVLPQGDLHVLDLKTGDHQPLPGASDPRRVENFPAWSPDGETVAFVRTGLDEIMHGSESVAEIATVPFNGGDGGEATPLLGASKNGKSNFYPVYHPSGDWMVFGQASRGFFSQIDSDLWVVPAEGGEARRLGCNSGLAETWHRFDPSGRWLAMVSNREDVREPDVLMARFDAETGDCEPPVRIPHAAGPGAHVHAFAWSKRFDWLDDGLPLSALHDLPGDTGDTGLQDLGEASAPEGVTAAMDEMSRALTSGDADRVGALFLDRDAFLRVSDCEPPDLVDMVMEGRDQALERARRGGPPVGTATLSQGFFLEVAAGDKPSECRAKEDVAMFRATYRWTVGEQTELGEAHFLRVDGDWRFVKL